ncbi:hypothetical protein E2320_013595 [Naja naja]|nr:hypothetical protein E2320_013595 [Naja naja]
MISERRPPDLLGHLTHLPKRIFFHPSNWNSLTTARLQDDLIDRDYCLDSCCLKFSINLVGLQKQKWLPQRTLKCLVLNLINIYMQHLKPNWIFRRQWWLVGTINPKTFLKVFFFLNAVSVDVLATQDEIFLLQVLYSFNEVATRQIISLPINLAIVGKNGGMISMFIVSQTGDVSLENVSRFLHSVKRGDISPERKNFVRPASCYLKWKFAKQAIQHETHTSAKILKSPHWDIWSCTLKEDLVTSKIWLLSGAGITFKRNLEALRPGQKPFGLLIGCPFTLIETPQNLWDSGAHILLWRNRFGLLLTVGTAGRHVQIARTDSDFTKFDKDFLPLVIDIIKAERGLLPILDGSRVQLLDLLRNNGPLRSQVNPAQDRPCWSLWEPQFSLPQTFLCR